MYIYIDCQSSILSHMVPELNIIGFVGIAKAASENPSVPYSTDSPCPRYALSVPLRAQRSLRAQRVVAGSIFLNEQIDKKRKKPATYP